MTSNILSNSLNAMTCMLFAVLLLNVLMAIQDAPEPESLNTADADLSKDQEPISYSENYQLGKILFKGNCASCHNKNMKDDLTGPALGGSQEQWNDYPKADLYDWIRNSQKLVADKHPRAIQLIRAYDGRVMTSFPNLTDIQIDQLFEYINTVAQS